jgi:hypothetical protein
MCLQHLSLRNAYCFFAIVVPFENFVNSHFQRFEEVILDFSNVESIGPAFADEIFRVFTRQHPKITLQYANANEEVRKMIMRAQSQQ